jgi:DNA-binding transcriptional regulator GbsR (MarR family)
MPDAVTRVERFVTDDVPQLAESYLVEAEKSIGDLRKEAEKAILDYSQQTLTGLSGEAKRHMAQIINRNKDMLKDALEELSEDKGGEIFKNALKLEINKLLEKEIGRAQVVAALGKYKRPLMDVQKKLDMLKNTPFEKLNEEQQLERRLIVLGRALLLESKKE